MTDRPTLADVAAMIANGEPPDWLLKELARFAPLVGGRRSDDHEEREDLSRVLAAIDTLEHELYIQALIEEAFGFETPECIDAASPVLFELREFFEEQRIPARRGGPTPDGRRRICAGVCAGAWRRLHGKIEPYSVRLQDACEAYWLACGHAETSTTGRLKNWEPFLVWTATP
jgi:hypothetical protein